jgi:hypothetical protein
VDRLPYDNLCQTLYQQYIILRRERKLKELPPSTWVDYQGTWNSDAAEHLSSEIVRTASHGTIRIQGQNDMTIYDGDNSVSLMAESLMHFTRLVSPSRPGGVRTSDEVSGQISEIVEVLASWAKLDKIPTYGSTDGHKALLKKMKTDACARAAYQTKRLNEACSILRELDMSVQLPESSMAMSNFYR